MTQPSSYGGLWRRRDGPIELSGAKLIDGVKTRNRSSFDATWDTKGQQKTRASYENAGFLDDLELLWTTNC